MTEKTIQQLALEFTGGDQNFLDLDIKAMEGMGFTARNIYNIWHKSDLHEMMHLYDAILRKEKIRTPDYGREIGATIINYVLRLNLPNKYEDLLESVKEYSKGFKQTLIKWYSRDDKSIHKLKDELKSIIKEELKKFPNSKLQEIILKFEDSNIIDRINPLSWFNNNEMLRRKVSSILKEKLDFNHAVIGSLFGEEVKDKVIKIKKGISQENQEYYKLYGKPLEEFITNEEITERIGPVENVVFV